MAGWSMPEALTTETQTPAERYGARIKSLALSDSAIAEAVDRASTSPAAPSVKNLIEQLKALPQPGHELWKYTPVNRIYEALADIGAPLKASDPKDIDELLTLVDGQRYPLAAMTALALHSASRVTATQGQQIELLAPTDGQHWQHVEVPANTTATLVQRQEPAKGAALITTIRLGEGATLAHSVTGCESSGTRWQLLSVNLHANSSYHLHQLSLGGAVERLDTHIRLNEEAATASLTGALLCGQKDRCDNQTVLEHRAPRCTSTANYHGLAHHTGKLTFGGRIHILESAAGTDARLHNPNLLLSESAEINTKPELEIYNDDVACAHGATVGRLDEDSVFYLRSRGISRAGAQALLLRGFVNEAVGGPDQEHARLLTRQRLTDWTL